MLLATSTPLLLRNRRAEHSRFLSLGVDYVTRRCLAYINSQFCVLDTLNRAIAGDIAAQALAYVEAINFSVDAAQNGFTIAVEAITLIELIPHTPSDQHQSYLMGMLQLAQDGHNNAAKTLQMFRNVRTNVLAVCDLFLRYSIIFICSA
jgi:hypothetical protein